MIDMNRVRVFFDMDGVLVDFDKARDAALGPIQHKNDFRWEDLYEKCPLIYLEAEKMPKADILWDFVTDRVFNVFVLTAIPRRWSWPKATDHKRTWMRGNYGLHHNHVLFGPYAEDKQYHCTGPNDILIDDNELNVPQWRERGGTAILHTSVEDTLWQLRNLGF